MSLQRTEPRTWEEEKEHRRKVLSKLQRVQGLQSLIDEWEPIDSDEARDYLRELKERLRQARHQYFSMKP